MPSSLDIPRPAFSAVNQTLRFLRDPFALIDDVVAQCGDLFALRLLGLGDWVFVASPPLVKEMFKAPRDVLAAGAVNASQLGFMLGLDATFSLDGEAHRERQRIVQPSFNGRRVLGHVEAVRDTTLEAIAGWPRDRAFPLLPRAHRISLDVLVRVLFADLSAARRRQLADLFERFSHRGLRSPLIMLPALQLDLGRLSPWGRVLRLRARVREVFGAEIDRRLARRGAEEVEPEAATPDDELEALIAARERDGRPLGRDALLDEVINLLFAGHETTGSILTWSIEALLSHPKVLQRVREELGEVLGGGPIEVEHLPRLEYLQAVISEATRARPIAPMAGVRKVLSPFELGGYRLQPGMVVAQCFPAMARRPDLFRCPRAFDPEHFHGRKLPAYDWNPFGGGTRMCIGRGLAEVELKVVLATLLMHANLRLAQEQVRSVRNGVFFTPDRGLQVAFSEPLEAAA